MALDFIAIDFETANRFRDSPCALGVSTVSSGKVVKTDHYLMRPPWSTGPEDFDDFNIGLHGISWESVKNSPEFIEVWESIYPGIEGTPIIAHNAAFDIGVLRDAIDSSGGIWPTLTYTCTLVVARRVLDLPSYSLPYVASEVGVQFNNHHDAAADAEAAASIMLALCSRESVSDLDSLLEKLRIRWGRVSEDGWNGSTVKYKRSSGALPAPRSTADQTHPLYGQFIAITGTLPNGVPRSEAQERIAYFGGTPQQNVTRETTMLVVGDVDPHLLAPGKEVSSKMSKGLKLRDQGQRLEIISGIDFLPLLD